MEDCEILKYGEAYDELKDHPHFKTLMELEAETIEQLIMEALNVSEVSPTFATEIAYRKGIVDGVRKINGLREYYHNAYKEEKEMENDGRE